MVKSLQQAKHRSGLDISASPSYTARWAWKSYYFAVALWHPMKVNVLAMAVKVELRVCCCSTSPWALHGGRTQYALVSLMELAKTSRWTFCTCTTVLYILHLLGVWGFNDIHPHACRMPIVSIGFLKASRDPYWWLTGRVALFPGPCHSLCTWKQHWPIAENEATGRAGWHRIVHTFHHIYGSSPASFTVCSNKLGRSLETNKATFHHYTLIFCL